ncbi:MAG: 4-hydroxy-tetrahydrodipicolinate reductase [Oscillospiraceae bacterium]|nr:4-hydroxy-tetrahydrodipicolinate reductase [Oscillospiraceae bacterium]
MRIIINGACGRMGSELQAVLACGYRGHNLAAAVDPSAVIGSSVLHRLEEITSTADMLIDFSHHTAIAAVCSFALSHSIPVVIATTGHTPDELSHLQNAARQIPVFHAANLSLGAALLFDFSRIASAVFEEADIEIVELHHNHKLDAPSGTASELAEQLAACRPAAQIRHGRSGHCRRQPEDICIHALRMGSHAGSHTVLFGGDEQTFSITHTAHTPRCYAQGALYAAEFILNKPPGMYGMSHLTRPLFHSGVNSICRECF